MSTSMNSAFIHWPPFDSSLLLREPQKPQLADDIWTLLTPDMPVDSRNEGLDRYALSCLMSMISTNDMTHQRRIKGQTVRFKRQLTIRKAHFLANTEQTTGQQLKVFVETACFHASLNSHSILSGRKAHGLI